MNKTNLVILSVLFFLVITAIVSAWPWSPVQGSPYINANACNADGTCEVKHISSSGNDELQIEVADGLAVIDKKSLSGLGFGYDPSGPEMIISTSGNGAEALFQLLHNGDLVIGSSIYNDPKTKLLLFNGVDMKKSLGVAGMSYLSGGITSAKLTGNGNAYACINANGTVFRSKTACA
jgi:hypothetical protein